MGNGLDKKKVLIIDDDENICDIVEVSFSDAGAKTYVASHGKEGLQQFFAHRPDLVILDVMMPEMDGWMVCQQIRLFSDVPIIMLTALQQDNEIIRGLDYGADDFISKPFSTKVLLARARALLRRTEIPSASENSYNDGYLSIDLEKRQVLVNGTLVKLTATEFRLLAYLLQNARQVLTYSQILESVWGPEYRDNSDYVHVYLSHLRKKIEEDPRNPRYLLTEHGVGYRFQKQ